MYLLTYTAVFMTDEGGEWATTRRMTCLHKGVWVPGVRYLIPFMSYNLTLVMMPGFREIGLGSPGFRVSLVFAVF